MTLATRILAGVFAAACVAAAPGASRAGFVALNESATVTNFPTPVTLYKAFSVIITDQTGEVIEGSRFDVEAETGVFVGDSSSTTPRAGVIIEFLDDVVGPGDQVLRFQFPANDPWGPGETLNFRFGIILPDNVGLYKIDWQFELVPTPGAAALLGLAGLCSLRRRRSN